MLQFPRFTFIQWIGLLWLLIGTTAVLFIPVRAQDDLHYLGIAWTMLKTHSWLVTYAMDDVQQVDLQKTPLLYWLILSVWHLFGISTYSVKAVIFLIGSACLWITYRFAIEVFPENKKIAELSLVILFGNLLWPQYFGGNIRFEGLVTFFGILYLFFLVKTLQSKSNRNLLAASLSLGICLFSKGGVGLIYYLPLAFLAPYLVKQQLSLGWTVKVLITVGIGLSIPALYLLYIYLNLGSQELNYLLFKQISERVGVHLTLKPVLGFITCFLPLVVLFKWKKLQIDQRVWVLLWQIIFVLVFFVFFVTIPAKRYFIPLCPPIALILAFFLSQNDISERRLKIFALLFGVFIIVNNVSEAFGRSAKHYQNLAFLAQQVKLLQVQEQPVVQFTGHIFSLNLDFLALLPQTLPIILDPAKQSLWLKNHPNGYIIQDCKPEGRAATNCFKIVKNRQIVSLWKEEKSLFIL